MKIFRNKQLWTAVFYIWLIALLVLTSMSFPNKITPEEESGLRWDYFEHFFLYLVIPVLYFFSNGAYLHRLFKQTYYILIMGLIFVSLTEIQQYFIEGRSYNPLDLVLNISGYLTGIPLGRMLQKKLIKSKLI